MIKSAHDVGLFHFNQTISANFTYFNIVPNAPVPCNIVAKIPRATAPKPAVPKRDEKPIHGLVSDKNFIVANAVENILAGK